MEWDGFEQIFCMFFQRQNCLRGECWDSPKIRNQIAFRLERQKESSTNRPGKHTIIREDPSERLPFKSQAEHKSSHRSKNQQRRLTVLENSNLPTCHLHALLEQKKLFWEQKSFILDSDRTEEKIRSNQFCNVRNKKWSGRDGADKLLDKQQHDGSEE